MTCPVCGRGYERRLRVNLCTPGPSVWPDFEVCRAVSGPCGEMWYLHDPAAEDRGIVGNIVAGIREVL